MIVGGVIFCFITLSLGFLIIFHYSSPEDIIINLGFALISVTSIFLGVVIALMVVALPE